ncbi:hypothetical protein APHWI1_0065 [Anaplasma phagocytophilum str. ApWI1]|uniref:Uncharacterized protein n=1 Tax=Anaplasma phagocytophilum str. ApWI1 TaxID=1359155 RepID=A0A0F3Q0G9_ANAPH|nr:hypothetical protein APHWI1_0065 [Anaplasma phagocytophilum str. ApWI1]KJV98996.1 hypothetical protein OTSANNIE_0832 [Anaplasma phagocytophilum str. Annie]
MREANVYSLQKAKYNNKDYVIAVSPCSACYVGMVSNTSL